LDEFWKLWFSSDSLSFLILFSRAGLVTHAMLHAHKTPVEENTLIVISPRYTKTAYRFDSPDVYVSMVVGALDLRLLLFDRNGEPVKESAPVRDVLGRVIFARDSLAIGVRSFLCLCCVLFCLFVLYF
jgi:hypothetical protein